MIDEKIVSETYRRHLRATKSWTDAWNRTLDELAGPIGSSQRAEVVSALHRAAGRFKKPGEKSLKTPPLTEVQKFLTAIKRELKGYGDVDETDVRLQVFESGSWNLHSGDAQFDQDHRGYWGSSSVSVNDSAATLHRTAKDLIDQAKDHFAESKS